MKRFFLLVAAFALFIPGAAHASPKFLGVLWWGDHWRDQDFIPYYDNGTEPQNSQWLSSNWTPANWIHSSGGDAKRLVQTWQTVGIIKGKCLDGTVPALYVGPNFYRLSGFDKRRVTETIDAVYQMTSRKPGMYYLKDGMTKKIIGAYSQQGLNLE